MKWWKKLFEVISSFFYGILLFGRKNFCAGDFTTTVKAESIGQLLKTFQVRYPVHRKLFHLFMRCFAWDEKVKIRFSVSSRVRILAKPYKKQWCALYSFAAKWPKWHSYVMTKMTFINLKLVIIGLSRPTINIVHSLQLCYAARLTMH